MWKTLIPPLLYLLAVGLSIVSTALSLIIFILIPILNIWPGRIDRKLSMLERNAVGVKVAEGSSALRTNTK